MKKTFAFLLISSLLTFAACQSNPKTEETRADTTTVMATDTALMTNESMGAMATGLDTTVVAADSVKK